MPGGERGFGADDREVDLVLLGELDQPRHVGRRDVDVLGVERGAGVAGGDEHAIGPAALADLPRQRVFAATVANDQDFHRVLCELYGSRCASEWHDRASRDDAGRVRLPQFRREWRERQLCRAIDAQQSADDVDRRSRQRSRAI